MSDRLIAFGTIAGMTPTDRDDRLDRIAQRASARLPPLPRTCTFCRLEYRYQQGVLMAGRWYCDVACARQGSRFRFTDRRA